MQATFRERLVGGVGAAIVVAGLGYALLFGMIVTIDRAPVETEAIVEIAAPLTAKPRLPPPVHHPQATKASPAAPRNLWNKATDIVALPPLILTPPPPLVAAPKAGIGLAASAGASDRPGAGDGAGGHGNGTGDGGDGADGDIAPRQVRGRLKFADIPADLRNAEVGGTVSVRYAVEIDGRVDQCGVVGSSGSPRLDALTCQLIEQRFRFKPSHDRLGRPVRSIVEENHSWLYDHAAPPDG